MIRVCRLSVCYTLTAIFATVLYSTLFATVARGAQVILTFDDIATASMPVPMPAGYGGVNWAGNIGVWADDQPPYNPKSPPNRVLFNLHSESGVAESIVAFIGGPKSFAGAYFSG